MNEHSRSSRCSTRSRGLASSPGRGQPREHLRLQRTRIRVDQRCRELALVGVAAVERALPHAGGAGDLLHRHRVDALGGEQPGRGVEHARTVASRVGAFVHG